MHLNIHSIQLHIEELRTLLGALDIIAISESNLKDGPKVDIILYIALIQRLKKEVLFYM